jgi:hypothetical protein
MAEITALTLTDSIPTARTFDVAHKSGFKARWIYDDGSVMALRPFSTMEMRPATNTVSRKTTQSITLPYEVTVNAVTVTKYASVHINAIIPSDCPTLVADNLIAYANDMSGLTSFADAATDEVFPY